MEGHDVPTGVLTDVIHWLLQGGDAPIKEALQAFRDMVLKGGPYCRNDGCEAGAYTRSLFVLT
jgi:hypothetical protein